MTQISNRLGHDDGAKHGEEEAVTSFQKAGDYHIGEKAGNTNTLTRKHITTANIVHENLTDDSIIFPLSSS
jgi:hypothetical protein